MIEDARKMLERDPEPVYFACGYARAALASIVRWLEDGDETGRAMALEAARDALEVTTLATQRRAGA